MFGAAHYEIPLMCRVFADFDSLKRLRKNGS